MSVATEIARIQSDRNKIRTKLAALGLTTGTATLDDCATAVEGISDCGAVSATVQEGSTYTIPKGYHNGSGTVSGVAGGGNYSLQSKTVTPTKSQANVTPDSGYYGLSDVTVNPIPDNYQDVTPVTAGAGHVLANKVIVDATGKTIAGTMPNNGAVSEKLGAGNDTYTVPAGYHTGSGTVKINWMSGGAIPSKETVTISATKNYALSSVVVEPIPDAYQDVTSVTATADDVLAGEKFVAADGTVVTGTIPVHTSDGLPYVVSPGEADYVIAKGYHDGGRTLKFVWETPTVTPTKSKQTINPQTLKLLESVVVNPIPDKYQDVSGVTATAANVLSGSKFVNASGTVVTGTMTNRGKVTATIDGLTVTSYTIPAGYHNGSGTVSLTSDIETALAAI